MLSWTNRFNICCFLDNQQYDSPYHTVECLAAAGALKSLECSAGDAFKQLQVFFDQQADWLFGHFSFDLKNELESLQSKNPDDIQFPDLFFFVPEVVLHLNGDELRIGTTNGDHETIFRSIGEENIDGLHQPGSDFQPVAIHQRVLGNGYIDTVRRLQEHILKGDCYEINYCIEFFSENAIMDSISTFLRLNKLSPNPFSCFYKVDQRACLCASPERFLKKTGQTLTSQPMKGTRRRTADRVKDEEEKMLLHRSNKDRSENVMVVDLVRNDLSKVCTEGSVKVDELFGVYSFPNVHQMISTVSGTIRDEVSWLDAIKACFPMGSMTGAPKKRVLELIDQYESSRRGLFSGSIGYITPDKDFDFNVVIRSILYNAASKYLSYQTGSAITFRSNPLEEYEECLLKGEIIKKVLAQ
jgi:para-aminobenzoate synthetase component I